MVMTAEMVELMLGSSASSSFSFACAVPSRPIMIPLVFLFWCPSINPAGYVNVAFSKSVAPSVINFVRLQRDPEALGWWGLGFSVGT